MKREDNGYRKAPYVPTKSGNHEGRRKYSEEVVALVCKRWKELSTVKETGKPARGTRLNPTLQIIAKETGLSHGQVKNIVSNYARPSRVSPEMSDKVSSLIGHAPYPQICRELGVSAKTIDLVVNKMRADEADPTLAGLVKDAQSALIDAQPVKVLERMYEKERKFISGQWKPPLRIAVGADIHFPFQCQQAIDDLLAAPGKFDFLILVGDVYDMYNFSTFRKESVIPFTKEFQESLPIWNKLVKKFGHIIYIAGSNHERRLWMRLTERARDFTSGLNTGAQRILYDAIDKIRDFYLNTDPANITVHYGWWLRFGKVIFAHPDRFLRRRLGTAEGVSEYFMERYVDFDSLFVAHTHRLTGITPVKGKWLGEIPAMCTPIDYMADAGATGGFLHNGYAIVQINEDGRLDYNNSRIHFSGVWGGRTFTTLMGGIE